MTSTGAAPRLSAVQKAWLQELGLPRAMLKRYASQPAHPSFVPTSAMKAVSVRVPARVQMPPGGRDGAGTPSGSGGGPPDAGVTPAARRESPAADAAIVARSGELPADLDSLAASAQQCRACALCQGRSHVVFGSGEAQSPQLMIIGEAPGDQDDRTGLPFQGDAGYLLEQMLHAIGVERAGSVYFANLVKCRPLGNRPPSNEEVASCLPYLRRQIGLIKPRHIVVLGRVAAQALISTDAGFDQLRADVQGYRTDDGGSIPVLVSYHPTYLLLQPQHKLDAWRDLNRLRVMLADGGSGS